MVLGSTKEKNLLKYMDFLHSDAINDNGYKSTYVFLGVKSSNRNLRPVPVRVEEILNGSYLRNYEFNQNCDYYITSNTFRKHNEKSRAMLFSLENIIIDIDNHNSTVYDMQVQYIINMIMRKADFKPTAINRTGRGVQLVYQIEKVSYKLEWLIRAITECLIKNIESIIAKDTNLKNFEVDVVASKNTAGFFRLAGTFNTKVGKLSTFEVCGRKYNHQEFADYYRIAERRKAKNLVKRTGTPIPRRSSTLFTTRLKWIQERIAMCQSNHEYEGFRDKCLFLAGNCYYFQNSDTFRERLERLNDGLMLPLDINQVRNIEDTIEKAKGYRYSNVNFLKALGYTHEQANQMYTASSKRLQGQENTKKIKSRNEQIVADFLAEVDTNPKGLSERLAEQYNLSKSQINRIVQETRKQHRLEKAQRVTNSRISGELLREIALDERRSVSTIHRLAKISNNVATTTLRLIL